jgi:hypothetical protein
MADVAEECGLSAVQISKCFNALPLLLVSASIGNRAGNLASKKGKEG